MYLLAGCHVEAFAARRVGWGPVSRARVPSLELGKMCSIALPDPSSGIVCRKGRTMSQQRIRCGEGRSWFQIGLHLRDWTFILAGGVAYPLSGYRILNIGRAKLPFGLAPCRRKGQAPYSRKGQAPCRHKVQAGTRFAERGEDVLTGSFPPWQDTTKG